MLSIITNQNISLLCVSLDNACNSREIRFTNPFQFSHWFPSSLSWIKGASLRTLSCTHTRTRAHIHTYLPTHGYVSNDIGFSLAIYTYVCIPIRTARGYFRAARAQSQISGSVREDPVSGWRIVKAVQHMRTCVRASKCKRMRQIEEKW